MAIFLILVIFLGGLPIFDFMVFQDMQECLKAKATITEKLKENGLPTPLYLECKSDAGEKTSIDFETNKRLFRA